MNCKNGIGSLLLEVPLIDDKFIEKQSKLFDQSSLSKNVVYFNDSMVILEAGKNGEELEYFYNQIKESLVVKGNVKTKLGIGISQQVKRFDELERAYKQAVMMVNIGNTLHEGSFVSSYEQNRLLEIIEKVPDTALLVDYVQDKLGMILDYDKKNGTDLMDTLHILIQYSFNYKKAAECSYVHYNTIRYRANKIMQLGLSFEQGQNLAEIILAYNIYLWLKATKRI